MMPDHAHLLGSTVCGITTYADGSQEDKLIISVEEYALNFDVKTE